MRKAFVVISFVLILFTCTAVYSEEISNEKPDKSKTTKIDLDIKIESFRMTSLTKGEKYFKKHKVLKGTSIFFYSLGTVLAATGLGLFIQDKAGGKETHFYHYPFMFSGLFLINCGLIADAKSSFYLKLSKTYKNSISIYERNFSALSAKDFERYYVISSAEKLSARKLKAHGIATILMTIPMIALSVYSFHDSYRQILDYEEAPSSGMAPEIEVFFIHLFQAMTLTPTIVSIVIAKNLIKRAKRGENFKPEDLPLTLENVSPMINPITKTYGISMGFSF